MNLIMTRHPVTIANIQGLVQHEVQGDLALRGYYQIKRTVHRLDSEYIDFCYSSDADRCRCLAEAISLSKGIKPIYNPLFREIKNGEWNKRKKEEIERLSLENPVNVRPKNGESLQDLANRAMEGLEMIKSNNGERGVLVSHGWFLKVFLGLQLGMTILDSINQLKFSNCAISEITLKDQGCLVQYLNNRDYLY